MMDDREHSDSTPRPRLFGRIGRRLLRWFLLVALIPLLFMGYYGYSSARRGIEREVFLHLEAVAMSKRNAIEQWFVERRADLRVLAANPLYLSYPDALQRRSNLQGIREIADMLRAYQRQSRSYVHLCLYDPTGEPLLCTVPGGEYIPSFSRSTLLHDALASFEPSAGPIYLNPTTGPTLHLAQTIRSPGGAPLGVIVATLVLAATLDPVILDSVGLGRTGQAYLIDRDKVMLTPSRFMNHPDPLTHTMDSEGIRAALTGSSGTGVYQGYDGESVIGAWTYLPDHGWALIVEMSASEALAPLRRMGRNALLAALLTLGAVTLIVAWISRSISAPIHRLAQASLSVSRGNLNQTVTVRLRDELGELAERFNTMVRSLRDSRSALQDAYDKLLYAQKQIVQAERLAAVGEVVASVVHEIRNPLSSVKMNLRILEGKCGADPKAAEYFHLAKEQTERLETMLADLLDFSKPVPLQREAVRIQDIIDDAVTSLRSVETAAPLPITIQASESLPLLWVDRGRIVQVLLNLLLNARAAIPCDGTIQITAETISEHSVPALRLTVSDNGSGITEENQKRIFEPFFTTRKQGTGLGLSNARKLVEAHGGTLSVASVWGKGTTVHVILPIAS